MFVQILRKISHLQVLKSMLSATQYQYKITYKKNTRIWFISCGIRCSIYGMTASKMT